MHKSIIIIFACLLMIMGRVKGQDSLVLSLEQAKAYALGHNKLVKNAGLAVELAQKKINESISSYLPQADAAMDYSNYLGAEMQFSFSEEMPPQTIPFDPTSNLYVNVSQLIFSGNFFVGLQMLKMYKEMSGTRYLQTEQGMREMVTKSYYYALVSELTIDILLNNLANTRKIYENTKAMESVGMTEKLDIDQFEVQMASLENALKSAERQKELSYNLLRFQLGVPVETPLRLTDSLDGLLEGSSPDGLLDQAFSLDNNLDYQVMASQLRLSEKQVDLQKMNYLPSLTSFYQYTEKIKKSKFDLAPKNVIGLSLHVPIFSSGMRSAQVNQARIQLETTRNNQGLLSDQLLLQEKQSRYNLATAMEQLENRKNNVEVAYRIYQNYQLKYEQGIASSLDLTLSNNNYLQAETEYLSAIISLFDARLAMQKLLNTL